MPGMLKWKKRLLVAVPFRSLLPINSLILGRPEHIAIWAMLLIWLTHCPLYRRIKGLLDNYVPQVQKVLPPHPSLTATRFPRPRLPLLFLSWVLVLKLNTPYIRAV